MSFMSRYFNQLQNQNFKLDVILRQTTLTLSYTNGKWYFFQGNLNEIKTKQCISSDPTELK